MELALSVWLLFIKNPKKSLLTTVANSSAQKDKKKKETTMQEKKRFVAFKKIKSNTKQTLLSPLLPPIPHSPPCAF